MFDLFGTLVDGERFPEEHEFAAEVVRRFATTSRVADALVADLFARVVESWLDPAGPAQATADLVTEVAGTHGLAVDAASVEDLLWDVVVERQPPHLVAPEAAALLADLRLAGHCTRLLSNCVLPGSQMWRLLERLGLATHLCDASFSSDGQHRKPQPSAFTAIAYGDPIDVTMVGDSQRDDLDPSRALGWAGWLASPTRLPTMADLALPAAAGRERGAERPHA